MEKLRIIVGGYLGIMPVGGISWDFVQYPLGLFELGHDVYYIEDTLLYPLFQRDGSKWDDASASIEHLGSIMKYFGMGDRWAYRDEASGKCFGLPEERVKEICKTADVFINVSHATFVREEYMQIPVRILVDTDPMFTQIQYVTKQSFTADNSNREMLKAHNFHFTFGENIASEDCQIPDCGLKWEPTRQPVCLEYWKACPVPPIDQSFFSTVMTWQIGKNLIYQNEEWGQKDAEFPKIISVPLQFPELHFSVLVNHSNIPEDQFPRAEIIRNRWKIVDPNVVIGSDWLKYQQLIRNSVGEFSIAKETYVKARSGWFSGRSACYLATGRPVVTQDTGWSKYYPTGKGLFAFQDGEEAIEAIYRVKENLSAQSFAARSIAEEFFDSNKVLHQMLEQVS